MNPILLIVIFEIAILIAFVVALLAASKKSKEPDGASKERASILKDLLVQHFGTSWKAILSLLVVLMLVILIVLYLLFKNLGENSAGNAKALTIVAYSIVSFLVVVISSLSYYYIKKDSLDPRDNYITADYNLHKAAKARTIIQIVLGLVFTAGLLLLIFVWNPQ